MPAINKLDSKKYYPAVIYGAAICFVLLYIYSAVYPSAINWGVHHLGFLGDGIKIIVIGLMVLMLVPRWQNTQLNFLERTVTSFVKKSTRSKTIFSIIGLTILIFCFWMGRERTLFLGDGLLVARNLPQIVNPSNITKYSYYNEPLAALVISSFYSLSQKLGIDVNPTDAYRLVSIIFGILSIMVLWLFSRIIARQPFDRLLIFGFIFAGGATQLFFGYVEDYAPLYFGVVVYVYLCLQYLGGNNSIVWVGMTYALMFLLHFGTLIFVPSLLLLFYHAIRRKKIFEIIGTLILMVLVTSACLWLCGFTAQGFFAHFAVASQSSFDQPVQLLKSYDLISFYHFLDIANLLLLLSPFAVIIIGVSIVFLFKREALSQFPSIYLGSMSLGGLALICGVNSLLGVSRDWDLFASYGLPLCITSVFLWNSFVEDQKTRRSLLFTMTILTLLSTTSWVLVNANEDSSVKRFESLGDKRFWSDKALIVAYEDVASWYLAHGDNRFAMEYYQKYIALDSFNPRVLSNVALVFGRLGDHKNEVRYCNMAADHGSVNEYVYFTLSNDAEKNNRLEDAKKILLFGLQRDSNSAVLNNQLGLFVLHHSSQYQEALGYFFKAAALNSELPQPYFNTALCYYKMGDTIRMNYFLDKYSRLNPYDNGIQKLRQEARKH
ncbi:MAG: hypothetical protein ACHQQQ_14875 [Bacteroidota bacterium]